jgi:putative Mg2+ transporter-C (MgtC) family protein
MKKRRNVTVERRGAGVTVKEGLTKRGLTSAALIWEMAAIGILTGISPYFAAGVGTVLTLGTLSLFRWIEGKIPTEFYARFSVRFARHAEMPEAALRELVARHGFSVYNLNCRLVGEGTQFEYRAVLRAIGTAGVRGLSDALRENRQVLECRIAPRATIGIAAVSAAARKTPSGTRPPRVPPGALRGSPRPRAIGRGACRPR